MKFPPWHELLKKISEFERAVEEVKAFQEEYPVLESALKGTISVLPPPFDSIAENIYNTTEQDKL